MTADVPWDGIDRPGYPTEDPMRDSAKQTATDPAPATAERATDQDTETAGDKTVTHTPDGPAPDSLEDIVARVQRLEQHIL